MGYPREDAMKRLLIVFCLVLTVLAVSPAKAYNVTGSITGGSGLPLRYIYAVPTSLDTFFLTIAIPFVNTYSFTGMQEGSYLLFSFQDLNTNLMPDLDEPRGFYGGQPPQMLVLTSDTSGINIELLLPNSGGFTGTVAYSGTATGASFVYAHRSPAMTDSVRGIGILLTNNGNGTYTCFVDSFGVYYAEALMELTLNFQHDANEPYGVFGGSTPAPINVQPTNFPDNIDITLLDPNAASPPLLPLPNRTDISRIYPNPFNSQTRITFALANPGQIELSLYDILGRQVEIIASGRYSQGEHELTFNAGDLPSGLYFVNLQSGTTRTAQRLLLLK